MRAVLRFLGSRWFLSFIGVALLGVLVWLFGPFLSFLEAWIPRAIVIVGDAADLGRREFLARSAAQEERDALVEGVTAAPADPSAAASAEEVAAMRDKLTTALALLKKASGARGYLYEQPWYAIIGPPGAGKTTALLNAGLTFPLAAEMGQSAVAGVGGTRMCDWWFTESAVLIDTAGRYTTQDSDAAVDKAGWQAFLGLLKRTRARQPLNGVLVAIALSDIAAASPAERLAHARAIRRRVKELYDQLGVRVPVYALFTKADLIAGFTEFFDDLDRERRGQVWGVTFPLNKSEAGTRRTVRRGIPIAGGAAQPAAARSAAGRAQPGSAHADRRFPRAGRQPRRAAERVPRRGVRRLASRSGAVPARRLSDVGHAGRHADRSPDRRDGAQLRHRCTARAVAAAGARSQLFPRPAAEGRDLRRGDAGVARSRRRAAQYHRARRRGSCRAAGRAWRRCRAGADAAGEPARARTIGCGARRLQQDRAAAAAGSDQCGHRTPNCRASCRCSTRRAHCRSAWMPDRRRCSGSPACRRPASSAPAPATSTTTRWNMCCCRG